jgi:hypothetical protein
MVWSISTASRLGMMPVSAKSVALPRTRQRRRRPLSPRERARVFMALLTFAMFAWVLVLIFTDRGIPILYVLVCMYVLDIPDDWQTLRWFARWCAGDLDENDPGPVRPADYLSTPELVRFVARMVVLLVLTGMLLQAGVSAVL